MSLLFAIPAAFFAYNVHFPMYDLFRPILERLHQKFKLAKIKENYGNEYFHTIVVLDMRKCV